MSVKETVEFAVHLGVVMYDETIKKGATRFQPVGCTCGVSHSTEEVLGSSAIGLVQCSSMFTVHWSEINI